METKVLQTLAKIVIQCDIRTGEIQVGGHLDNKDLCMSMLCEALKLMAKRPEVSVIRPNGTSLSVQ